jgi:SAM-dependent methyltransferase
MVYLNPRPDESSIGRFYPEDYAPYQPPSQRPRGWMRRVRNALERLVWSHEYGDPPQLDGLGQRLLARLVGPFFRPSRDSMTAIPFHGAGRLLEFGCGSGWFAYRMQQRGFHVTGLDASAFAAAQVTRHFGIPVHVGTLPHRDIADASFDLITMGAVLEHVHWPRAVFAAAAKALRRDGLLVVSVPNIASWGFRYFGRHWWPLELPRHLLHFTPATLTRLARDHGFDVLELRMPARTSWMTHSVNTACRDPQFVQKRRLVRLAQHRFVRRVLTRWTVQAGQGDCLMMIARRAA